MIKEKTEMDKVIIKIKRMAGRAAFFFFGVWKDLLIITFSFRT